MYNLIVDLQKWAELSWAELSWTSERKQSQLSCPQAVSCTIGQSSTVATLGGKVEMYYAMQLISGEQSLGTGPEGLGKIQPVITQLGRPNSSLLVGGQGNERDGHGWGRKAKHQGTRLSWGQSRWKQTYRVMNLRPRVEKIEDWSVIDVILLPEMSRAGQAGRAKKKNHSYCPSSALRRRGGAIWRNFESWAGLRNSAYILPAASWDATWRALGNQAVTIHMICVYDIIQVCCIWYHDSHISCMIYHRTQVCCIWYHDLHISCMIYHRTWIIISSMILHMIISMISSFKFVCDIMTHLYHHAWYHKWSCYDIINNIEIIILNIWLVYHKSMIS